MNFSGIKLVYFSPTKTTKRILVSVAQGLGIGPIDDIDITLPNSKAPDLSRVGNEIVIMGSPVYGGRIPSEAARRFRLIKGSGAPAVVIVLYGNREYEDSLRELTDIAVEMGFKPVACAAFLGEHSFSSQATPIAQGRPDARDLAKAKEFGGLIRDKVDVATALEEMDSFQIPGNSPYKQWKPSGAHPVVDESKCVSCNECVFVCPMGAISEERENDDPSVCICCSVCVKTCAQKARLWKGTLVEKSARWLWENCKTRKEPEVFV